MSDVSRTLTLRVSREELVLILITMIWGGTFLVVHRAMAVSGPFFFVGLRFATAALILACVFRRALAGTTRQELIAGALITETVFGLGGLGQLTQQAVNNQDVAVLQAVVMISALGFVAINLLVDLLMPLFDPRLQRVAGGAL